MREEHKNPADSETQEPSEQPIQPQTLAPDPGELPERPQPQALVPEHGELPGQRVPPPPSTEEHGTVEPVEE